MGESVLTNENRVGGLVDFWRVCFDYLKVCIGLVEVQRVRFDYHKACRRLVEGGSV